MASRIDTAQLVRARRRRQGQRVRPKADCKIASYQMYPCRSTPRLLGAIRRGGRPPRRGPPRPHSSRSRRSSRRSSSLPPSTAWPSPSRRERGRGAFGSGVELADLAQPGPALLGRFRAPGPSRTPRPGTTLFLFAGTRGVIGEAHAWSPPIWLAGSAGAPGRMAGGAAALAGGGVRLPPRARRPSSSSPGIPPGSELRRTSPAPTDGWSTRSPPAGTRSRRRARVRACIDPDDVPQLRAGARRPPIPWGKGVQRPPGLAISPERRHGVSSPTETSGCWWST